jgi:hypothetical protein
MRIQLLIVIVSLGPTWQPRTGPDEVRFGQTAVILIILIYPLPLGKLFERKL